MLDKKDCNLAGIIAVLDACRGLVDMIRIAVAPVRFLSALDPAETMRKKGFVGLIQYTCLL